MLMKMASPGLALTSGQDRHSMSQQLMTKHQHKTSKMPGQPPSGDQNSHTATEQCCEMTGAYQMPHVAHNVHIEDRPKTANHSDDSTMDADAIMGFRPTQQDGTTATSTTEGQSANEQPPMAEPETATAPPPSSMGAEPEPPPSVMEP